MSKCKPTKTDILISLEKYGVSMTDQLVIRKDSAEYGRESRDVVITIPYDALRDQKDVQIAFQDLVTISTK